MATAMKHIGSRNLGCTVHRMEWSNKMDLIAYGTEKGEVIIQRLNWQKIYTFPAPGEGVTIKTLSWRLDETVLAVGYSNGKVALLDIERESTISILTFEDDIKKVYFSKAINVPDYRDPFRNTTELTPEFFLPELPPLNDVGASSSKSASTQQHKSLAKGSPCFLVIIMNNGKVYLLLLGALKAGTIELSEYVRHPKDFQVFDVCLSGDFNAVYALVRDGNELRVIQFINNVLRQNISPMLQVAGHCANILEAKCYINDTIQSMLEAWESVLIEMDNKLTKYANSQPAGSSLSADLLELLVFGYASHEIEEFLMDSMTDKALKKLANSLDLSYTTIQTLVMKHLQMATVNMFFFLHSVKGLTRMLYYFLPLISFDAAHEAVRWCGAFLMKIVELQHVIDQSMGEVKLFFTWLNNVIMRLHHHGSVEAANHTSQEEIAFLTEYLNGFEETTVENEDGTTTRHKFNVERIGQYFENANLHHPHEDDQRNEWKQLVEQNDCLKNSELLYPHEKETSLLQQRDKMFTAIDKLFSKPNETISGTFEHYYCITCARFPSKEAIDSDFVSSSFFVSDTASNDRMITTISWQEAMILDFDKEHTGVICTRLQLLPGVSTVQLKPLLANLRFIDLQFYNESTISLLLQGADGDKQQCYFVQLPLDAAKDKCTTHKWETDVDLVTQSVAHSVHDLVDTAIFKAIDLSAKTLAVSGSRKVASILSDCGKKMAVFELEIEEDEDDNDISQTSLVLDGSKDSASSMQH